MDKKDSRPEAYPRPSPSDLQYSQQNEFIGQQPNNFEDSSVSHVQAPDTSRQNNQPETEKKE